MVLDALLPIIDKIQTWSMVNAQKQIVNDQRTVVRPLSRHGPDQSKRS